MSDRGWSRIQEVRLVEANVAIDSKNIAEGECNTQGKDEPFGSVAEPSDTSRKNGFVKQNVQSPRSNITSELTRRRAGSQERTKELKGTQPPLASNDVLGGALSQASS